MRKISSRHADLARLVIAVPIVEIVIVVGIEDAGAATVVTKPHAVPHIVMVEAVSMEHLLAEDPLYPVCIAGAITAVVAGVGVRNMGPVPGSPVPIKIFEVGHTAPCVGIVLRPNTDVGVGIICSPIGVEYTNGVPGVITGSLSLSLATAALPTMIDIYGWATLVPVVASPVMCLRRGGEGPYVHQQQAKGEQGWDRYS